MYAPWDCNLWLLKELTTRSCSKNCPTSTSFQPGALLYVDMSHSVKTSGCLASERYHIIILWAHGCSCALLRWAACWSRRDGWLSKSIRSRGVHDEIIPADILLHEALHQFDLIVCDRLPLRGELLLACLLCASCWVARQCLHKHQPTCFKHRRASHNDYAGNKAQNKAMSRAAQEHHLKPLCQRGVQGVQQTLPRAHSDPLQRAGLTSLMCLR